MVWFVWLYVDIYIRYTTYLAKYIVCLMHKEDPKPDILAWGTEDTKVVSTCTKVTDLWGPIPNPYNNIEVQASSC